MAVAQRIHNIRFEFIRKLVKWMEFVSDMLFFVLCSNWKAKQLLSNNKLVMPNAIDSIFPDFSSFYRSVSLFPFQFHWEHLFSVPNLLSFNRLSDFIVKVDESLVKTIIALSNPQWNQLNWFGRTRRNLMHWTWKSSHTWIKLPNVIQTTHE